jgi:periplasmic divalent cation tolerance protein
LCAILFFYEVTTETYHRPSFLGRSSGSASAARSEDTTQRKPPACYAYSTVPRTHPHAVMDLDTTPFHIVLCNCPDAETAERIANTIVEQRLAACVNHVPGIRSVYWWDGHVERGTEHLLVCKSEVHAYGALQARLLELHPYELPEVVAVPITAGSPAYLSWIRGVMEK